MHDYVPVLLYAEAFASIALRWRHNGRDSVSNKPASPLLTQPFIQTQIKENIKATRHWPLWPGTDEFTAQMASYAKNLSIR